MERFTKCVTQSAITTVLSSVVDFKTGIPTNNLFTTDVKKELNYSEMLCLSVIILSSALIHVGIDFSFVSGNIFFTDLQKDSESPLFSLNNDLL